MKADSSSAKRDPRINPATMTALQEWLEAPSTTMLPVLEACEWLHMHFTGACEDGTPEQLRDVASGLLGRLVSWKRAVRVGRAVEKSTSLTPTRLAQFAAYDDKVWALAVQALADYINWSGEHGSDIVFLTEKFPPELAAALREAGAGVAAVKTSPRPFVLQDTDAAELRVMGALFATVGPESIDLCPYLKQAVQPLREVTATELEAAIDRTFPRALQRYSTTNPFDMEVP